MSDKTEKPQGDGGWVPSAEHPVPPTTEFGAVTPEPIDGAAEPDETPATAEAAPAASADVASTTADEAPTPGPAAAATEAPAVEIPAAAEAAAPAATAADAPAATTPPAAGLPPQWGDPDAQATGPQSTNQASNLWGLAPDDRPEVLLGAALAGGVLAAIVLRTLARR